MEAQKRSNRVKLFALLGAVVIILGVAAAYYETLGAHPSQDAQVSSLSSAELSLSQVVASQQSLISSLQSQGTTDVSVSTTTLTSTVFGGTTTLTSTSTRTVASTVTSVTTSTTTTTVSTVLPVGEPDGVILSGMLMIPNANGSGTLQIQVSNSGNDPIIGIGVAVPFGPDNSTDLCTSQCLFMVVYNGNPISPSNPLPVQNNVAGSVQTNEGVVGDTYFVTVTAMYADGTTSTGIAIPVTAIP